MLKKCRHTCKLYPTKTQEEVLLRYSGACRFIWNYFLAFRMDEYKLHKRSYSEFDINKEITKLKHQEEYNWLNDIPAVSLQQASKRLHKAFSLFYRNAKKGKMVGYPKFKAKKYTTPSFDIVDGTNIHITNTTVKIPKMSSSIKYGGRKFDINAVSSYTVYRDRTGVWYISFVVLEHKYPLPGLTNSIGIDLGLKHLVITSNGEKVDNPKYYVHNHKKLARLQRDMARKQKGSNNREKARIKLARFSKKIANKRKGYVHDLTTKLIRENQTFILESLRVMNMMKNRHLAKAIHDAGWIMLKRQLLYKADWYGRDVGEVSTWFPSSKMCSHCAHINFTLTLSQRKWKCSNCNQTVDRDINAAINILKEGIQDIPEYKAA